MGSIDTHANIGDYNNANIAGKIAIESPDKGAGTVRILYGDASAYNRAYT